MKNILLILFILASSFIINAQISVGPTHVGRPGKFNKEQLQRFKNSKTIFVFSTLFEKEVYENLLKDSWDVTPYEIVSANNFDLKDYLKEGYSIATLKGNSVQKETKTGSFGKAVTYLYMYFEFSMYENKKLLEKLNKNKGKKLNKLNKIINKHKITFARFELFPTAEFIEKSTSSTMYKKPDLEAIAKSTLTEDVFYNYQPGTLKNYFQKVNKLLKNEEIYWMYEDEYLPELKNLINDTLYIPDYVKIKYNPIETIQLFGKKKDKDEVRDEESLEKLFSNYEYEYSFLTIDDLNTRILSGAEFYYLRYVRVNSQKFFQIINSKTGEIVYRNYETGFSYNLKSKHLKELNKAINRSIKK